MKKNSINISDSTSVAINNSIANKKKVKALILTGFGLNCDIETAHAFELAGAEAHRVHINALISGKAELEHFHILAFGGGFSWGDDHGAGVIQALKLKNHIGDKILSFVNKGKLVIGICNGFQTLVNLGLLPGIDNDYNTRSVALTWNDSGNFRDQWVDLTVNQDSPCVFTKSIDSENLSTDNLDIHKLYNIELPIRHAQGKFVAEQPVIDRLIASNQVVLRYSNVNPNGSFYDIAGICDASGHVFGLMPHPEAYNHYTNHPDWRRKAEQLKRVMKSKSSLIQPDELSDIQLYNKQVTPGIKIFLNGVNYMASIPE